LDWPSFLLSCLPYRKGFWGPFLTDLCSTSAAA
jgi:hypothetical protein